MEWIVGLIAAGVIGLLIEIRELRKQVATLTKYTLERRG